MTETTRLRSYGRRKARPLSERKDRLLNALLPTLRLPLAEPAPSPLASLFAQPITDVWLEIGFGSGEHLVWQAEHHPTRRLHRLRALHQRRGEPARQDRDLGPRHHPHPRRRRPRRARLAAAEFDIAHLHPVPRPLAEEAAPEAEARFARCRRRFRQGAEARRELRFASDSGDYAGEALLTILASRAFAWTAERPKDWRVRPFDWPETRYERKALSDGRKPAYLSFRRL